MGGGTHFPRGKTAASNAGLPVRLSGARRKKRNRKDSLAVNRTPYHVDPEVAMTKRLLPSCLVLTLLLASGCLFSKKSGTPRESSQIAGEMEENFKRRWIEKRASELVAQRTPADAAQAQATREFDEKFDFKPAAKR